MLGWLFRHRRKTVPIPSAETRPSLPEQTAGTVAAPEHLPPFEVALLAHQSGRLQEAEAAYREVLARDPGHIDTLHFLGLVAYQLGRHDEAETWMLQALQQHENNVPARTNLGKVYQARGDLDQAIACYRRALELAPEYIDAQTHLGYALAARRQFNDAARWFRSALSGAPEDAALHHALGNALNALGELEPAIACFHRAITLNPQLPEAHCDLGTALMALHRLDEAIASYREALRLRPGLLAAHYNLGIAFRDQHRSDEAIACFHAAIEAQRDFADAYYGLGHTLCDSDRMEEARECFTEALSLRPDFAEARWSLATSRLPSVYAIGDDPSQLRQAFAQDLDALEHWFEGERAATGHRAVGVQQPFALAYQEENNRDLLCRYGHLCVRLMADSPAARVTPPNFRNGATGPIRAGIVSQHFRNHSVWNAIVKGWVAQVDRDRCAISGFYLGVEEDAETQHARSRTAHFEKGPMELTQWIEAIVKQRPEVLIYPEIGMDPIALKLASLRLARVQIATWGHPETTGLPTIDYYLSAQDLEPPGAQAHYTEHLIALPQLGVYLEPVQIDPTPTGADPLEIDPAVPVLVCPGTPFKYAPRHDHVFPQIASRLGECRFVFFRHWTPGLTDRLQQRLKAAFENAGLEYGKYVSVIPWQSKPAFFGLLRRADVFLDTIGFSGFNTALQAVACGLPVVTVEGRFLRGRLASGILRRAGMDELVASSTEDYVELVVRLIEDAGFDQEIRKRLCARRDVLYRNQAPIRALEDFLAQATRENRS